MKCPQLHFVLCCIPCFGHTKPLIFFAEQLAGGGHKVTLVSSKTIVARIKETCRHPSVEFIGLDDGLIPESEDFFLGKPPDLNQHPVWYAQEKMIPPLTEYLEGLHVKPDMVVSDHLTWAGAAVARHLDIRHACHVTWPLHMLERAGILPHRSFARYVGDQVCALRSYKFIPSFARCAGPPQALIDNVRRQCVGLGDEETGKGREPRIIVLSSCFGLEPPRPLPSTMKIIGRGGRPETAQTLTEHRELKVGDVPRAVGSVCREVVKDHVAEGSDV